MVRSSSVLSILTWKCASRHNGVHFFMSHLASWLRTRRFSEPTFRPSGATNHWKNTVNRDFPIFSRIYLFFLLIFSLLSASSLLCVSTVHIVGSLASKLPSIKDGDFPVRKLWLYQRVTLQRNNIPIPVVPPPPLQLDSQPHVSDHLPTWPRKRCQGNHF